jgi:hypothetical protein
MSNLRKLSRTYGLLMLSFLMISLAILPTIRAVAQSESDLKSIYDDTTFYDPFSSSCPTQTNNTTTAANPVQLSGTRVFYIGDSLTYHMAARGGQLLTKTAAAGYAVDTNFVDDRDPSIPRVTGVSVDAQGGINVTNTIPHILQHPPDYINADIIVIGLGTNFEQSDFTTAVSQLIKTIRTNNTKATIYWVNTYWSTQGRRKSYQQLNQEIAAAAVTNGFTVIDYASAAEKDPSIAPAVYNPSTKSPDGIHVDTDVGRQKKADWIISQLPKPGTQPTTPTSTTTAPVTPNTTTAPSGTYDPTSLNFPSFPNEALMATNIEDYIRKGYPSSPWFNIPNLGTWLMTESKNRNINPMLVMVSGKQENAYGTVGDNPRINNNFFGMKGQGGYIHFSSAQEGMTAFLDALKRNIIDKSNASYKDVTDMYEYFSVHQTGGIHYPGDGLSLGDPQMPNAHISWDSQYNPGNYWKTAASVISSVSGLTVSPEIPPKGSVTNYAAATGCTTITIGATTKGDASKYITDCNANGGNAAIVCTAINQLTGIPYDMSKRAPPTEANPQFLDCSSLVNMAIYRTFGLNLGGLCSADFLSNQYMQVIDIHSIQPGDMIGHGAACGGAGHVALVVSYDATTKKLIAMETGSPQYLSGIMGAGLPNSYGAGLKADGGNGGFEWAVRYVGPKTLQPGAL